MLGSEPRGPLLGELAAEGGERLAVGFQLTRGGIVDSVPAKDPAIPANFPKKVLAPVSIGDFEREAGHRLTFRDAIQASRSATS